MLVDVSAAEEIASDFAGTVDVTPKLKPPATTAGLLFTVELLTMSVAGLSVVVVLFGTPKEKVGFAVSALVTVVAAVGVIPKEMALASVDLTPPKTKPDDD